ncbi:thioesterase family protein [Rhodococcus hoagii]|nr:thioesterase family protein [Prescottella equi]
MAVELSPELGAPGVFLGHTSPAYANMVGPFGGITAATLLRAVLQHPERLGDPLSLTVNFAGPIADGAFEVSARPTRNDRSTQHWNIELAQDGVVRRRPPRYSAIAGIRGRPPRSRRPRPRPDDVVAAAGFPDFIAWRAITRCGSSPASSPLPKRADSPDSTTTMWVRDAPPRALDFPALTSLCDVYLPARVPALGRYLPAGTVSSHGVTSRRRDVARRAGRRRRPRHRPSAAVRKGLLRPVRVRSGATTEPCSPPPTQLVYFKD